MSKAADAFRTIGEVADELGVPKHVLRFWEGRFPQIRPMKRGGGRRFYRPEDLHLLRGIKHLLHSQGFTIKGVQRILREQGVEAVKDSLTSTTGLPPAAPPAVKGAGGPAGRGGAAKPGGARGKGRASAPIVALDRRSVLVAVAAELATCRDMLSDMPAAQRASAKTRRTASRA